MRKMNRLTAAAVCSALIALGVAPAARAQSTDAAVAADAATSIGVAWTSTSIALPLTVVAGIGIGVYFTVRSASKGSGGDIAEAYLRSHSVQLARELRVGSGATLTDIAVAAGVGSAKLGAFGAAVRANAAELLSLSREEQLTQERAVRFMDKIEEIAKSLS